MMVAWKFLWHHAGLPSDWKACVTLSHAACYLYDEEEFKRLRRT